MSLGAALKAPAAKHALAEWSLTMSEVQPRVALMRETLGHSSLAVTRCSIPELVPECYTTIYPSICISR